MSRAPEGEPVVTTATAWWQQAADRLARSAWLVLLVTVVLGLVGGVVSAAIWQPGTATAPVDACQNPPCFGVGEMPGLQDLPMVIAILGYLLAIVLGLPSLLAGLWDVLRGRWAVGGRRLLPFVGPALLFVGTEIIPHLLNPCFWALTLGGTRLPEFYCAYSPEWGVDVADRWHLLDHTLVGAVPLTALYSWVLRRWHPAVARRPRWRAARPR